MHCEEFCLIDFDSYMKPYYVSKDLALKCKINTPTI